MNGQRKLVLSTTLAVSGLLALSSLSASPARAASLTMVSRSIWTNGVNLPSYLQMYIYVPDKMAARPPIVVSAHSCGSTATGQMGNIPMFKAAADAQGFILVLPDNPNQNCWDVGSGQSLKHDGGGDTQGVAQMVKYALMKYGGDPSRVYIMGGSSGAMLTQAMLAVYPDLFRAGAARAGVPAGCWTASYDPSMQWSDPCANGTVSHTAMEWGDLVRKMDPGYAGHRPRLQLMQGESDSTISYNNTGESIKEWTNVLGLPTTPTSMDKSFKGAAATWDRQFWKNGCGYQVLEAWSAPGQGHSMTYEEAAMMAFFGLDGVNTTDPESDCTGGSSGGAAGGSSGAAGSSGSGGALGAAGGASGAKDGGADAATDGGVGDASSLGSGGVTGTGGTSGMGSGGVGVATGGTKAGTGGLGATGGTTAIATGGAASGGTLGSGGSGAGGTVGSGGASSGSGSGGSPSAAGGSGASGCAVGGAPGSTSALALLLLATGGALGRRRRR